MYKIAEKINFPSRYIELKHDKFYVLVNCDNNKSRKFSIEEFKIFKDINKLKDIDSNCSKIIELINSNENIYNFVMQLVMSGIIALKPFQTINEYRDTKPVSVYLGLTDNCNFRCQYCYAKCGEIVDEKPKSILDMNDYKNIINKIKDYGFIEVVLTGGEPLLNPNTFEIAKYAKERGLICGILTNGSLIKHYNIDLFKNFDYVKISIDSHDKETNDLVRGNGSYNKIIEGIKLLRKNNINVDIGSVITKFNKDNLKELILYLNKEFGVKTHTIVNHIPIGRGATDKLGCTFDEIQKCDEVIFKTKLRLAEKNLYTVIQDFFFPDNSLKMFCGMGASEIFVNKNGDVYPCRMTYDSEYLLGNIIESDLSIILKNVIENNKKLCVDNLEGCKSCNYRYLCGGGCRMYHKSYSGSEYVNDPEVCNLYKRQLKSLLLIKNGVMPY